MSAALTIPTVTTERLVLRAPDMRDFDTFAAFWAGPRSVSLGGPVDRTAAFQKFCAIGGQWQLRGYGRWIVADRDTDAPLGIVGIFHPVEWPEPEIAWTVFDGFEGRGVACEAAIATRAYAYETLGWSTLVSLTEPDNARSIALAKRLGARHDGEFDHPAYGPLNVWRHLSPGELAA